MQSPSSSSTTAALPPHFQKLISAVGDVVCLPTSPAHSTATLPPLPNITLSPPGASADALVKHQHHVHSHHPHVHDDDDDDEDGHSPTLLQSPTPSPAAALLPQATSLASLHHDHALQSLSSLSSHASAQGLSLPSPPSPSVSSGRASPPDAPADKMEILPSPLLWEALCSVVDADEDEPEYDASPDTHGSGRARAVPNDDANRYAARVDDVGMVDWDHMDDLMGTREYGAW